VSQIFFGRTLFEDLQFDVLGLSHGYAYEDWHFATESVALGYKYFVTRDTIMFYRERQNSLLRSANSMSVRQISPSTLFQPKVFSSICGESYQKLLAGNIDTVAKENRAFVDGTVCRSLIYAANLTEPAIAPEFFHQSEFYQPVQEVSVDIGKRYHECCKIVRLDRFTDIFLFPHFGKGGAERYIANVIFELLKLQTDITILTIVGQPHSDNEWLHQFPPRVNSVDLGRWYDEIGSRGVDVITLKLVQSVGKGARPHARPSPYCERFLSTYGRALDANKRIFYRFGRARRVEHDTIFDLPWGGFDFLSKNIENIDTVITDNRAAVEYDCDRIGGFKDKWYVLPPRFSPGMNRGAAISKARKRGFCGRRGS
jgi:hypothetical protein